MLFAMIYLLIGILVAGAICLWDPPRDISEGVVAVCCFLFWPAFLLLLLVVHLKTTEFGN